ncbi:MAG: ABC-F family ATP-binding cassette domain-containing protein [Gammaproteobacteria bacterium]|nr:ABC-F family ATP-binding cassette domain-containing protein [Gammaproteobacteria bacterium]
MHKPIQIKDLDLSFPHKTCFENFSCQIPYGSRIAIIGRNGSGKSILLKMIASLFGEDAVVGYVPQVIVDHTDMSGGQRLNKAVTEALSLEPNVLLLDEPTNHLDTRNRKSLMRMLQNYSGTLIMVSHDKELLRQCTDTLWHIDHGKVHIFPGNYDDYMHEIKLKRASIEGELELLSRQKKDMHHKLMQEQQRAAKSKNKGQKSIDQRKWPTVVSNAKAGRAEETSGRKKSAIDKRKSDLTESLSDLRLPEIIIPKFSLESSDAGRGMVVQISGASMGYFERQPILSGINLSLQSGDRLAITGDNGSGKSTLIKAILGDESIYKTGDWHVIKREDVGYLDQHYSTLHPNKTVLETIADLVPHLPHTEIRRHLNDFLFRKNEEVNALVSTLSGGEKARLSLAQIAAKTPKLMILDEITNNLDLETKEHVVQVLKAYPGAMIVISHEADFLEEIGITEVVDVHKFNVG